MMGDVNVSCMLDGKGRGASPAVEIRTDRRDAEIAEIPGEVEGTV
jgi:hypothetical protein